ncbi:OB-fold domain-containing protein [Streptomyces yunnanensis]|uniref:OB-fold domain-containing protein n=2 Tax=Streptomyces yunnanensis TaxID=156453 RepID=A0ABY8ALV0_9ACTN|nr:OB-fold domain-containing protein [Streptomyces yunnanensis]WEB45873.1 OB-fold domain-containing protein [Streptomyces yunnanensis]
MNTSLPPATDTPPDPDPDADADLLRPIPDDDGAPFWEYAARGELRVQTCSDCDEPRFPPRPCCPHCQSFTAHWQRMSGRGRIWSYVLPHPPLLPAYAAQAPYNAIIVELTEAPRIRLVGNLVATPDAALNSVDPARLRIGAPVKAVFHALPGGPTVPRWVLERP